MIAHARELDPFECCGLLAGQEGVVLSQYRIANTVANDQHAVRVFAEANVKQLGRLAETARAEVAYFMDPKELLAAQLYGRMNRPAVRRTNYEAAREILE